MSFLAASCWKARLVETLAAPALLAEWSSRVLRWHQGVRAALRYCAGA
jgi:hypothetical protein